MVQRNSKPKEGLQKLLEASRDKDHWDLLEELRQKFYNSAQCIGTIRNSLEASDITSCRKEIVVQLVKAMILMETTKLNLSIMPSEWNKEVDFWVGRELEAIKPNFDDMEF